jgi:hypothetical protein
MRRVVFALSLLVLVQLPLGAAAPFAAGDLAAQPAPQLAITFAGRPTFKEGSDRAYFVWSDGNDWHVRWTTLGQTQTFTGTVRALGGEIKDLKRIDVDAELKVVRPGRPARVVRGPAGRLRVAPGRGAVVTSRTNDHITQVDDQLIRWNTRTDDDIDGIDFEVDDVRTLTFDLKINGDSRPLSVDVGRNNVHPADNPFVVRIR